MKFLPQDQREAFREDVEEVIRNAYAAGWTESKRWPNRSQPPELEIDWSQPGGIRIVELWP